jgi:hypothetical protein
MIPRSPRSGRNGSARVIDLLSSTGLSHARQRRARLSPAIGSTPRQSAGQGAAIKRRAATGGAWSSVEGPQKPGRVPWIRAATGRPRRRRGSRSRCSRSRRCTSRPRCSRRSMRRSRCTGRSVRRCSGGSGRSRYRRRRPAGRIRRVRRRRCQRDSARQVRGCRWRPARTSRSGRRARRSCRAGCRRSRSRRPARRTHSGIPCSRCTRLAAESHTSARDRAAR